MKFLVAFVAVIAVAASSPLKSNKPLSSEASELQAIVAAIVSPSTDPATAALLEQQLQELLGIQPEPVVIAPALVEEFEPIAVGPEIIDFPVPDGGAVSAPAPAPVLVPGPIDPSPVVIGDIQPGQTPLVQLIINVNQAAGASPVPAPAVAPEIVPTPVIVVEEAQEAIKPEPVIVVDPVVVEPVQVVDPIVVEPVQVAEPIIIEPVIIGTPIIPAPAVVLPEELN